jgi:DNA-binding MarR family transcriptional regulator
VEDPLRDCLGFRLGSAHRRVDRLFNHALAQMGIANAHAQVLLCLLAEGELRMVDIARRTGFDHSTVSRLVKELSRRKLVRRRPHPDDGRAQLLRPGVRGEALRDEIGRLQRRLNDQLRRNLTEADLQGFFNAADIMDRLP